MASSNVKEKCTHALIRSLNAQKGYFQPLLIHSWTLAFLDVLEVKAVERKNIWNQCLDQ